MGNVLIETQALNILTDRLLQWIAPLLSEPLPAAITLYWIRLEIRFFHSIFKFFLLDFLCN